VGLSSKEMAVVFKSAILYGKAQRVSVEWEGKTCCLSKCPNGNERRRRRRKSGFWSRAAATERLDGGIRVDKQGIALNLSNTL
jgi:hypothetical protein